MMNGQDDDRGYEEDYNESEIDEAIRDLSVDSDDSDDGYEILTLNDITQQIISKSEDLANIISLQPCEIRLLLHHFKFDSEKLLNAFNDAVETEVFLADTIYMDRLNTLELFKHEGSCEICYCDEVTLKALCCGHLCCTKCWNSFIKVEVKDNGNFQIKCFESNCNIILTESQVESLLSEEEVKTSYRRLLANDFVDGNDRHKWCTGKECTRIIQLSTRKALSVYCECGIDFCSACYEIAHLPLSCQRYKTWQEGKKDSENVRWIQENSRPCPQCKAPIQKDGGCNFMNCTNPSCRASFCWACMRVLEKTHGSHNCSRFGETYESQELLDLKRFEHYKNRFNIYRESEVRDLSLTNRMNEFCQILHNNAYLQSNIDIVKHSFRELLQSRRIVAYACAFSYYLNDSNRREIFEYNLGHLEHMTEYLSAIFSPSSEFWSSYKNSKNLTNYLSTMQDSIKNMKKYRHKLLEHCADCIDEGFC